MFVLAAAASMIGRKMFILCDEQGADGQAILYEDRSCFERYQPF